MRRLRVTANERGSQSRLAPPMVMSRVLDDAADEDAHADAEGIRIARANCLTAELLHVSALSVLELRDAKRLERIGGAIIIRRAVQARRRDPIATERPRVDPSQALVAVDATKFSALREGGRLLAFLLALFLP